MAFAFFLFRASACQDRSRHEPKRRRRSRCPSLSRISRKLRRSPKMFYGICIISVLFVTSFCFLFGFNSSVFYATTDLVHSGQSEYLNSDLNQLKDQLTGQQMVLQGARAEHLKDHTVDISPKKELERSQSLNYSKPLGPPSYLPLAQHLKHMNYTRTRISLRDMVFGTQKRTFPDLEPTNNYDLLNCEQCSRNCKTLGLDKPHFDHRHHLARLAVRLVTFYNLSSMLVLPCIDEIHWILPLNVALRKLNPRFEMYCAVTTDKTVVDAMKRYDRSLLTGYHFVVYQPMNHGSLPKVDVMFTWRGLEQYDLEAIQEVFKEAVKEEIRYLLVGNSPGYENAKVVETGIGTFSIKRPEVAGLNVRAYPFGFKEAMRVFSLVGKQLLFYNTSNMRDGW